ncbi:MAG: hypothetical protein R2729_26620 [Bryobacteraceae bacterium]
MFFRHQKPKELTFSDRISQAASAGFKTASAAGATRVSRDGFAADLREAGDGTAAIASSGIQIGDEIGLLTDLGYQKIFRTKSGKTAPARAEHLKGLHAFIEDLREALGLISYYNEGLGTTNELHLYDRVEDRDAGVHHPWER